MAGAWYAAVEARQVFLDQALRLTLLLGREQSEDYEAAARRFLVRFLKEVKPTLEQAKKVADALNEIGKPDSFTADMEALPAMADLARQLRERRP